MERVTEHGAAVPLDLHLERGKARLFVIAPAWPGWARSQRTKAGDAAAIEALLDYAPRYGVVAARASLVRHNCPAPTSNRCGLLGSSKIGVMKLEVSLIK